MQPNYTAQLSIYLRLVNYGGKALTTDGVFVDSGNFNSNVLDVHSSQLIKVASYSNSIEQTLNIGSQSTGAGAGKITFNPLMITKSMDAVSPVLFQIAASGTAYKTAELFFVNAQSFILSKQTYKLVAVKTVTWSADGDSGVLETVSFEYGGQIITVNKQGADGKIYGVSQAGWNKIKNVSDNDTATAIA